MKSTFDMGTVGIFEARVMLYELEAMFRESKVMRCRIHGEYTTCQGVSVPFNGFARVVEVRGILRNQGRCLGKQCNKGVGDLMGRMRSVWIFQHLLATCRKCKEHGKLDEAESKFGKFRCGM